MSAVKRHGLQVLRGLPADVRGRRPGGLLPLVTGVLLLVAGLAGFAATLPTGFGRLSEVLPLVAFQGPRPRIAPQPAAGDAATPGGEPTAGMEEQRALDARSPAAIVASALRVAHVPVAASPNAGNSNGQPASPTEPTPAVGSNGGGTPVASPIASPEPPAEPVHPLPGSTRAAVTSVETRGSVGTASGASLAQPEPPASSPATTTGQGTRAPTGGATDDPQLAGDGGSGILARSAPGVDGGGLTSAGMPPGR